MSDQTISDLIQYAGVFGTIDNYAATIIAQKDIPKLEAEIRQQIEAETVQRCIDAGCEYLRQCALNRLSPTQSGLEKALEAQK